MTIDSNDPTQTQKKILLVEDDDALANVYVTRLAAEGFAIERAANGEEALTMVKELKPDLIMLDIMMPKVSGLEVLDIIRNTPETLNVKVMVLSALGQEGDKQKAAELGADDYLVKSQVVITDVIKRIRKMLDMEIEDQL